MDVTLRHALTSDGQPRPRTAAVDGMVALRARGDKEATYPELVHGLMEQARLCAGLPSSRAPPLDAHDGVCLRAGFCLVLD